MSGEETASGHQGGGAGHGERGIPLTLFSSKEGAPLVQIHDSVYKAEWFKQIRYTTAGLLSHQ